MSDSRPCCCKVVDVEISGWWFSIVHASCEFLYQKNHYALLMLFVLVVIIIRFSCLIRIQKWVYPINFPHWEISLPMRLVLLYSSVQHDWSTFATLHSTKTLKFKKRGKAEHQAIAAAWAASRRHQSYRTASYPLLARLSMVLLKLSCPETWQSIETAVIVHSQYGQLGGLTNSMAYIHEAESAEQITLKTSSRTLNQFNNSLHVRRLYRSILWFLNFISKEGVLHGNFIKLSYPDCRFSTSPLPYTLLTGSLDRVVNTSSHFEPLFKTP